MSVDACATGPGEMAPSVAATLAAAEIPPSKLGPARHARLAEHAEVRGGVTSMEEATAAGRAVFGDVLPRT